jgi:hypothetical protein
VPGRVARLLPPAGPPRPLALISLIDAAGTGAFLAGSTVFFTRAVGLRASQVGLGLSVAGLCALAVVVPAGRVADRRGPKPVLVGLNVALALMFAAYPLVHDFWEFLLVVCVAGAAQNATHPVRSAFVYGLLGNEQRLRTQAYMRAVFNLGFALGALGAGIALKVDSRAAYDGLVLADAGTFLVCAGLVVGLPAAPARGQGRVDGSRWAVFRDRPFLAVSVLNGWLLFTETLLGVGVPLWVLHHTTAPRWIVAGIIVENTVLVVALQVRVSRGADTVAGAGRHMAAAAGLLALSCAVMAGSAGRGGLFAVAIVLLAGVGISGAEMAASAAGWSLAFQLPPPGSQGVYQGVFGLGSGVQETVGPYLVAALVVTIGTPGWFILAALFVAIGVAAGPVTRWAGRAEHLVPVAAGGATLPG